ncbi:2-oxo-tetronate isomerase [Pararobbsia silviterrae]|uniref:Hydroxypyruvate isomerase n=1 Tax=Pararobbsia silviterrae TaxID=1792498 RepID=A0A494XRN6_9BURK|nr:2-oxo-tetronate isomerase [Pararobbsia silviterrae]RKP50183.1 hydroxypyruvate isomerase [Pararobbsia silviterrae]
MPRFAANLSLMYTEHAFLDRFAAAARDGFKGVEFLFPYEHAPEDLAARLRDLGLVQVLFNTSGGYWANGERGCAALPGHEDRFRVDLEQALRYARVLGNTMLHVMAGVVPAGVERQACRDVYLRNLAYAASEAARDGITILIEPINPRSMPGYFLNRQDDAHAIRREVGASNLKVQLDLFHCQIVEGDLAMTIRRTLPDVAHIQVASVPERHEPDAGEVHYPYLFELIDELGYAGWIGCEYIPRAHTSEGLAWLQRWR